MCQVFIVLLLIVSISSVICITKIAGKINETCTLSNGKLGRCILIEQCKEIIQSNKTNETNLFVPCGENLEQLGVCCHVASRKIGEISNQKCKDVYLNRVIQPELLIINGGRGGYDARAKEYPHMAALGYGEWEHAKWACGGSLISEKFVLTAAHCIDTQIGPLKYIRLGDVNRARYSDSYTVSQNFDAKRTIIHPEYKPPSAYNDIALVELDRPFGRTRAGDYIAPACLQTERNVTDPKWTAIGWGETSHHGQFADHLQVMELSEADLTFCRDAFSNSGQRRLLKGVDNDSQICAGHGKIDTCQGDSGGPLQMKNAKYETGYTVIGVTSFGKPCVLSDKPGVYTRVSHYIEWIESIVWPEY